MTLWNEFLYAGAILITGTVFAFLIRKLSFKLLSRKSKSATKTLPLFFDARQIYNFAIFSSKFLFWLTVIVSLIMTLRPFGIHPLDGLGTQIAAYIPKLVAGGIIFVVGLLLAKTAAKFFRESGVAGKYGSSGQTAKFVYLSILIFTGLIATKQLGVDIEFLTSFLLVVLACLLGGGAISFGFGSTNLVSNILATYYLKKIIKVGQIIEGDNYKGRIVEISSTNVLVQTEDGIDILPSNFLSTNRFRIKNV